MPPFCWAGMNHKDGNEHIFFFFISVCPAKQLRSPGVMTPLHAIRGGYQRPSGPHAT